MIVNKTISVSAPLDKAFSLLEELLADVIEKKPAAELQGDAIAILGMFADAGQILPDYTADPEAVERTVELAAPRLIKRIMKALQAKGAATPGK